MVITRLRGIIVSSIWDCNEDFINSRVMWCCLGAYAEVGVFEKVDLSRFHKQSALRRLQGQRWLFSFEVPAHQLRQTLSEWGWCQLQKCLNTLKDKEHQQPTHWKSFSQTFRKDTLLTGYEAEALVSAGHFIKMKENELYVLIRYIFQQLIKAEEPGC